MPLYDYRCRACSKVTEVRHGFRDAYEEACSACGGELARMMSPAGIVFKGSGFYLTDSRKAAEKSTSASASESAKPAEAVATASDTAPAPATPAPAASAPATPPAGPAPAKKSESSAA